MTDTASLRQRLLRWATAPRDAAALVAFRIALGLLVTISAVRFLSYGWADELFVRPTFQFKYWGFSWVPALPATGMRWLLVSVAALGVCLGAGLFYRASLALLFVAFAWLQLIDVTTYLNHYYLVCLLLGLMFFIPAHRAFSLDAWRRPRIASATLPAWCTALLRFQIAVVYVNAGLAKLNGDWLLHAQPLGIWLSARTGLPGIGPWMDRPWVAFVAAWSAFLFDTTVVAFLSWRRSRLAAYVAVVAFHGATSLLFPIGMFPAIMTVAALVFFDPSWPRRVLACLGIRAMAMPPVPPPTPSVWRPGVKLAFAAAAAHAFIQIALPLRAHLHGGNVSWHEQGMRLSWRVMTREKNGSVTFFVKDPRSAREWVVAPRSYLNRLQEREMSVQPDLIVQLAHRIGRDYRARGRGAVEVRADAQVSLNGRPATLLLDPSIDLTRQSDGLATKRWILPAPVGAPIRMRPALAGLR